MGVVRRTAPEIAFAEIEFLLRRRVARDDANVAIAQQHAGRKAVVDNTFDRRGRDAFDFREEGLDGGPVVVHFGGARDVDVGKESEKKGQYCGEDKEETSI